MDPLLNQLSAYDYALPEGLIATAPVQTRDSCRLLALERSTGTIRHLTFSDLAEALPGNALLVLNNSKVLPARLWAKKPDGGRAELLFLKPVDGNRWQVLSAAKGLRPGVTLTTESGNELRLEARLDEGWAVSSPRNPVDLLLAEGEMPIPPYIAKARTRDAAARIRPEDRADYQTVYARGVGSVAAPTAGLHFTPELLRRLRERGIEIVEVTLHVGWGTFQPIRAETLDAHRMHAETFSIEPDVAARIEAAKRAGRPVVAVGSTSVRTLESAWEPLRGALCSGTRETSLFIRPGYTFQVVDQMITNFHVPKSSLLVMVSAFAGRERVLSAYREAIENKYRFFSYGDAMWMY